jgi:hypothetical protein
MYRQGVLYWRRLVGDQSIRKRFGDAAGSSAFRRRYVLFDALVGQGWDCGSIFNPQYRASSLRPFCQLARLSVVFHELVARAVVPSARQEIPLRRRRLDRLRARRRRPGPDIEGGGPPGRPARTMPSASRPRDNLPAREMGSDARASTEGLFFCSRKFLDVGNSSLLKSRFY